MIWVIEIGFAILGLALALRAPSLSIRYNAWTTSLRQRHPKLSPPPTQNMFQLNTKIMRILFQFLGVFLLLLSAWLMWATMR